MSQFDDPPVIAVFGGNNPADDELAAARVLGAQVHRSGAILLTGGGNTRARTVKDAAIRSAVGAAGPGNPARWIGVQRAADPAEPRWQGLQSIVVTPGLNHRRNFVEACLCDAAIAIGGGSGTASEVVFSLFLKRPVVVIGARWPSDPGGAVRFLRNSAVQRIAWPNQPQTAIDAGIDAAYRWADDPDVLAVNHALPVTEQTAARMIDELRGRIAAVSASPDFAELTDEHSWAAYVGAAIRASGRRVPAHHAR